MIIYLIIAIGSLTWIISLALAFLLGFSMRSIKIRLNELQDGLKERVVKEPEQPKPQSSIIDPTDIVQRAQFEQDEIQRRLNQ